MKKIGLSKLSTKITLSIVLFTLLPAFLIAAYLINVYQQMIEEEVQLATKRQVETTVDNINNHLNTVYRRLSEYAERQSISRVMNENYTRRGTIQDIRESLPELVRDSDMINAYVYVNSLNNYYCAFGNTVLEEIEQVTEFEKYNHLIDQSEFHVVSHVSQRSLFCVKIIRDYQSMLFRGLIIARIPRTELAKYMGQSNGENGSLYVISGEGELLYQPLGKEMPCSMEEIQMEDGATQIIGTTYLYMQTIPNTDMYVLGVNDRYLDSRLEQHFNSIFFIIAISVVIPLLISWRLLKRILSPVRELTRTIRETDPDDLKPVKADYKDEEIKVLAGAYNHLVIRVKENIDKKYKAEIALREAQINSLQYQINPHFVNNTLQLIGTMAAERDMYDLYDIILAFSRTFYYSIKFKGGAYVTLEDELSFLEDYITLQKARYPGKIRFSKSIEINCEDIIVPKLIIQPLIENCFSHGFLGDMDLWEVHVTAGVKHGTLKIDVSDNGKGMTKRQVDELEQDLKDPDSTLKSGTSHIGVRNVNARLCLLYGMAYRLTFASEEGKGTTFSIHIPAGLEEGDEAR